MYVYVYICICIYIYKCTWAFGSWNCECAWTVLGIPLLRPDWSLTEKIKTLPDWELATAIRPSDEEEEEEEEDEDEEEEEEEEEGVRGEVWEGWR